MSEEDIESPYCEVCGTCGYIGCCGIRNFIDKHIEGKTICKNEELIISELIGLVEYEEEKDKEIERLHSIIKEVRENIEKELDIEKICRQEKSLTICKKELLEILDKENKNV